MPEVPLSIHSNMNSYTVVNRVLNGVEQMIDH